MISMTEIGQQAVRELGAIFFDKAVQFEAYVLVAFKGGKVMAEAIRTAVEMDDDDQSLVNRIGRDSDGPPMLMDVPVPKILTGKRQQMHGLEILRTWNVYSIDLTKIIIIHNNSSLYRNNE